MKLAYAYILGREDGLPYIFAGMKTENALDDRFDDPAIVAGIRFHNLCLKESARAEERADVWRIEMPNTLGWQRGNDRFIVVNKAEEPYHIQDLQTSLADGKYEDIQTGWLMQVQGNGRIQDWVVPKRSAVMFVRVGL